LSAWQRSCRLGTPGWQVGRASRATGATIMFTALRDAAGRAAPEFQHRQTSADATGPEQRTSGPHPQSPLAENRKPGIVQILAGALVIHPIVSETFVLFRAEGKELRRLAERKERRKVNSGQSSAPFHSWQSNPHLRFNNEGFYGLGPYPRKRRKPSRNAHSVPRGYESIVSLAIAARHLRSSQGLRQSDGGLSPASRTFVGYAFLETNWKHSHQCVVAKAPS
jgi:hypothetical protein